MASLKALILAVTMLSSESINIPQVNNYTQNITEITTNAILSASDYNMSSISNYDSLELEIELPIINKDKFDNYCISVVGLDFHKKLYFEELPEHVTINDLYHNSNYSISLQGLTDNIFVNLGNIDCQTLENYNNINDAEVSPNLVVSMDDDILETNIDYEISILNNQLESTENLDKWTYVNHYVKQVKLKGINKYVGTCTTKTITYDEEVSKLNFKQQPKSYACIPTCLTMILNMEYNFPIEPENIISLCYKNLNYQGLNYYDIINLGNSINEVYDKNLIVNYFSDICTYNKGTDLNLSENPSDTEQLISINEYNNQPVLWYNNSDWDNTVLLSRQEIDEKLFTELDNLLSNNKLVVFRGKANNNPVLASHVILIYDKDGDNYLYCDPINSNTYICNRAYLENFSKYHKGLMYFE